MHTFYYNGIRVFEKNDEYYHARSGLYYCKAPPKKGYGPPTQTELDREELLGTILDIPGSVAEELSLKSSSDGAASNA